MIEGLIINTKIQRIGVLVICALLFASASSYAARKGSKPSADANPLLSFATDKTQVNSGETVLLSWSSSHTRFCTATGNWDGKLDIHGAWRSPPISSDQVFQLKCMAKGGGISRSVAVNLNKATPPPEPELEPEPLPEPESIPEPKPLPEPESEPLPEPDPVLAPAVNLQTSLTTVDYNGEVEISWSTTAADECVAGGSWNGIKTLKGTELVGSITSSSTFSLSCSGAGGTALEMVSVQVVSEPTGNTSLSWHPPTENTDGSLLEGLAGYVIYIGPESRLYSSNVEVNSSEVDNFDLALTPGSYYVAMRAVGMSGEMSDLSNEILLNVP